MPAHPLVQMLPRIILALVLAAPFAGCGDDGALPTEPAPPAASAPTASQAAAAVPEEGVAPRGGRALRQEALGGEAPMVRRGVAGEAARHAPAAALDARGAGTPAGPAFAPEAARGGNGNGKGKGGGQKPATPPKGGNGGGNGNRGKGRPGADLRLEIQPDVWNTNWPRSAGTVSALIRGSDLGAIDLDSIVLVGTDGAAEELEPLRVQRVGNHIRAFFSKANAFATLDTPRPGEVHEIVIHLTLEGEGDAPDVDKELSDTIRVAGPAR